MKTETERMKLWDDHCTTDPANTKRVAQRGGFTAICAQSQIREATRAWGPYGATWGVKDCTHDYIRNAAGEIVEAALHATFWYPLGAFPLSSDAAYKPGNDTRKKLLTDLTTKALSKLGFNADVFLGQYDDNKYVESVRRQFAAPAPKPAPRPAPQPAAAASPQPAKTSAAKRVFFEGCRKIVHDAIGWTPTEVQCADIYRQATSLGKAKKTSDVLAWLRTSASFHPETNANSEVTSISVRLGVPAVA